MPFNRGHALVIGVSENTSNASFNDAIAQRDAEAVADVLKQQDYCGYPTGQVTLLKPEQTTKAGIVAALRALKEQAHDGDTVFLYYSGHGMLGSDGQYYLVSRDAKIVDGSNGKQQVRKGTGVSEIDLLSVLRDVPAQKMLLVFNACFSGKLAPAFGTREHEAQRTTSSHMLPEESVNALLGSGEGRAVFTACREQEKSYFLTKGNTSFFAEALVNALKGKDIVGREDKASKLSFINLADLYFAVYESVKEKVESMFNEIQEPQLSVLKLVGAFPVALYNRQEESAISKVTRGAALVSGLHVIDKDTAKQAFERRLAQYQNQTDV